MPSLADHSNSATGKEALSSSGAEDDDYAFESWLSLLFFDSGHFYVYGNAEDDDAEDDDAEDDADDDEHGERASE